jgi:hypothetical protein
VGEFEDRGGEPGSCDAGVQYGGTSDLEFRVEVEAQWMALATNGCLQHHMLISVDTGVLGGLNAPSSS